DGITKITNDQNAADLQNAKNKAKGELVNYGQAAKDKIAKMPGLTSDQISSADAAIDKEVANGSTNIDNASDTAGVDSALTTSEGNIDKIVDIQQAASDSKISNDKQSDSDDVDHATKDAIGHINNEPNLTPAKKKDVVKKVTDDANQAKDQINKAVTPVEIKKAADNGIINDQENFKHSSNKSVSENKKDLPQTGQSNSVLELLGIMELTLLGIFGLAKTKKRKEK
ncbi:LPXTG cell wall anchor domain-containing protein, partial [Fructilactobacillus lindneri]